MGKVVSFSMQELAIGYMSGKLLLKLDAVSYLLQNHGSKEFAFLDDPTQSRNRTTFYFILARLLFLDESSSKYKAFLSPFQQVNPCLHNPVSAFVACQVQSK